MRCLDNNSKYDLVKEIESASRKAISSLLNKYNERFYCCSLITTAEGFCPIISAWSIEALEREVLNAGGDPEHTRKMLEWSHADSPYYAYGEEYFEQVKEIFEERTIMIENKIKQLKGLSKRAIEIIEMNEQMIEFDFRINAMEKALSNLDKEGVFGRGTDRLKMVINAEILPPDYTTTQRALRLNPVEALKTWLEDVAEWI